MMKSKALKRAITIIASIIIFITLVFISLPIGTYFADKWQPYKPDYEKLDLSCIYNDSLTEEEYQLLYRQTGLTKIGVDRLKESGKENEIYEYQTSLFCDYEIERDNFAPFTCTEYIVGVRAKMCPLECGDILVTPTTHFAFARFGHSALIVDGESGETVQALGYNSPSNNSYARVIARRPAFMVLRVKTDDETRKQVTEYAKSNLKGIEYSLFAGLFSRKNPKDLKKTQCAHLVWYAYKQFGIDIDGGFDLMVSPKNIARSKNVEIVQVFGIDLDKLW